MTNADAIKSDARTYYRDVREHNAMLSIIRRGGEAHLREICFDICYPGIVTPSAMREIREMLGRMVRQCRLNHEFVRGDGHFYWIPEEA